MSNLTAAVVRCEMYPCDRVRTNPHRQVHEGKLSF